MIESTLLLVDHLADSKTTYLVGLVSSRCVVFLLRLIKHANIKFPKPISRILHPYLGTFAHRCNDLSSLFPLDDRTGAASIFPLDAL